MFLVEFYQVLGWHESFNYETIEIKRLQTANCKHFTSTENVNLKSGYSDFFLFVVLK